MAIILFKHWNQHTEYVTPFMCPGKDRAHNGCTRKGFVYPTEKERGIWKVTGVDYNLWGTFYMDISCTLIPKCQRNTGSCLFNKLVTWSASLEKYLNSIGIFISQTSFFSVPHKYTAMTNGRCSICANTVPQISFPPFTLVEDGAVCSTGMLLRHLYGTVWLCVAPFEKVAPFPEDILTT